jgi:sodium pump decarboxylase gamma subunit
MIFEGVKLAFIGMATVLLFLSLMILLIQWVSVLTREAARHELEAIKLAKDLKARAKPLKTTFEEETDLDIAVIAAAVATYEEERFPLR